MRTTETLNPEDSLDRAASLLRNTAYPFVPIVQVDICIGVVSESSLARQIAEGSNLSEPCTVASVAPLTIQPSASGAEALRELTRTGASALLVLDPEGRMLGVVGPSDLTPQRAHFPTPPSIGGMATPFGVYLTTGTIHGGAGSWALMASGAMLFTMFLVSDQLSVLATTKIPSWGPAGGVISIGLFMLAMRMLPISGTHAAEHMVVHAIERGEELKPEIVRRMPRVHPRCGTNLAVGGALFLGIYGMDVPGLDEQLKLLLAFLAMVFLFRPLGALVQLLVTTKPPSETQIASGIKAGNELLERYRLRRGPVANPWQRIVNSGMLHVAAGSTAVYTVVWALVEVFHLPLLG